MNADESAVPSNETCNAAATPASLGPATEPAPKASKIRWGIHLAMIAVLPLVAAVGPQITRRTGPALSGSASGALLVCAENLLAAAVLFGVAWKISRATKEDLLLRWRPGFWVLPLGAAYSVMIRLVVAIVAAIVVAFVMMITRPSVADVQKFATENRPKVETLVDVHAMAHNPAYFWLNVIVVSFLLGGLREELWRSSFLAGLRSLWPRTFGSQGGGILAAAVAALFFGAGHAPQGMLTAAAIAVVGFLLGAIMSLHRSIWPSVVAHGLFDATSFALLPWAMQNLEPFKQLQHVGG